jgi:predicted NBD/HSP70 family sugar kinase
MNETTNATPTWTQPCVWCGHGCVGAARWCPECGHAAHTPKVYCTCGRPGCSKRTPADDYADEMAKRAVDDAMTDEQLAEARRLLDEAQARAQFKREDRH